MLTKFLPLVCIFCGMKSGRHIALCQGCETDLPWLVNACQQCALPLESSSANTLLCPQCQQSNPAYENTIALFHYQPPISDIIKGLKFSNQLLYAKCMGTLMAKRLQAFYQNELPDIIIPVPLHKSRLKSRGFNQALELARPITKQLPIPISYKLCQRTRATMSQSLLNDSKQRASNVKDAFQASNLKNKHVLVIDDVITTGSTIGSLSKELFQQGARRIDVVCCARTANG